MTAKAPCYYCDDETITHVSANAAMANPAIPVGK